MLYGDLYTSSTFSLLASSLNRTVSPDPVVQASTRDFVSPDPVVQAYTRDFVSPGPVVQASTRDFVSPDPVVQASTRDFVFIVSESDDIVTHKEGQCKEELGSDDISQPTVYPPEDGTCDVTCKATQENSAMAGLDTLMEMARCDGNRPQKYKELTQSLLVSNISLFLFNILTDDSILCFLNNSTPLMECL